MEAEPGQGAGSSLAGASPLIHPLCRILVVRHYKVKREGAKYVIDVEEPVSVGRGYWETQRWGLRPIPSSPDCDLYPPPVLLRLTRCSGQLFRVTHQEGSGALPAGRGLREGAR